MSHYTKEDIIRIVEEEDVEFIRLQFVDIFGILKNMAVTAKQLDSILNNRCTFDAAAINGFDTMHVDELVLVPDLDTFTIFPWRPQRFPLYFKTSNRRSGKRRLYVKCRTGIGIFPL